MQLLLLGAALAAPPQIVRVEVAVPRGERPTLVAETTWLGEERRLALRDDGSGPGDVEGDGLYIGEWSGEPVRMLAIRLEMDGAEVHSGVQPIRAERDRIAYAIHDGPVARRLSAPYLARPYDALHAAGTAAGLGWSLLILVWVLWLVDRFMPRERS